MATRSRATWVARHPARELLQTQPQRVCPIPLGGGRRAGPVPTSPGMKCTQGCVCSPLSCLSGCSQSDGGEAAPSEARPRSSQQASPTRQPNMKRPLGGGLGSGVPHIVKSSGGVLGGRAVAPTFPHPCSLFMMRASLPHSGVRRLCFRGRGLKHKEQWDKRALSPVLATMRGIGLPAAEQGLS